jgi:hypothetical protein
LGVRYQAPDLFPGLHHTHLREEHYSNLSLVYLAVRKDEVALFVRRLLRHEECNTAVKRMGAVIRVSHVGLSIWRLHAAQERHVEWTK